MERRIIDVWVGIFVVLGIGAMVFLSLKVANLTGFDSGNAYEVTAEFDNIGGLKVKAPVKNAGVVVGRVKEIYLDTDKSVALVVLEMDARYKFAIDSSASIYTSGLLGEQYISLQDGIESEYLKPGDVIYRTSSAMVLEKLIGDYMLNKAD